jgi:hypothetical protein
MTPIIGRPALEKGGFLALLALFAHFSRRMPSIGFLLQQFQLYAGDAGGGLRPVVCVLGARRTSHGTLQHLTAHITHYFRRLLCSD